MRNYYIQNRPMNLKLLKERKMSEEDQEYLLK
jgi:hypothetical protein